ncbi:MAG: RIP metalloprotease RseP [Gammaproteobacteria bacterium]|nr:RIP metalloprotease RseP [Gammaproteobacteria bacterium]
MSTLGYAVSFIVAIGVLVAVHEYGHFWVARKLGVKVLRFSIGFGKPVASRCGADGVEYALGAFPLGGYVKMLDEREGPVPAQEAHLAFNRQPLWVRYAVIIAGPAANFVFALVAYTIMFLIGVAGVRPIVGEVTPGSVAARAGIESEFVIEAVAGEATASWNAARQGILAGVLETDALPLTIRDPQGKQREVVLDLSAISLDDLTENRFHSGLGMQPFFARLPAVIGKVEADTAAARAGFNSGDKIVTVQGERIDAWRHFVTLIQSSPATPMTVVVRRGGHRVTLLATPAAVERDGKTIGFLGAAPARPTELIERLLVTERFGPLAAVGRALEKTWQVTELTLRVLWKMLRLEVSVKNISGPISIAQYAGDSARTGFVSFLHFLAVVSISIGILNLLPIPILDGGHLLFFTIEALKGSPLSMQAQNVGLQFGLMFLVGLMGLAFYNDVVRLLG